MKLSPIKLLTLYSIAYLLFSGVVLLVACGISAFHGFSTLAVGDTLMQWETHWWWLSLIGIAIHLFAYIKSLKRPRLLWGNLVSIWAFIAYMLIPNYTLPIALFHLIGIVMILGYHRPATSIA